MNEVKTPKKPLIVYYAIAILVVLLINTLLVPMVSQARVKYVDYGTFIQMTEEDKISEVQVQDNQIVFITKEDEANKNAVYYRTGKMDDPELTSRLSEHGVRFDKEIVEETSPLLSFLLSFVFPIVLFIALGQLLTRQMMKRMGGGKDAMSFGMGNSNAKVYVKDSAGSIKFDDVAGEDEAKENLSEIVNYLHDPSEVPRHRRVDAQGHSARRPARHGQNHARQGSRGRSERAVLLHFRLGICGDVRRHGRQQGA